MAENFEQDSYVQVVAPNGDYRYGYVAGTDEEGQHLTICMHEEADSKLAYEAATNQWKGEAPIGWQYGLSSQEFRVLAMVGKGLKSGRIAEELQLQPTTIRSYLRTLRLKLHVENQSQLVLVAQALLQAVQRQAEEE